MASGQDLDEQQSVRCDEIKQGPVDGNAISPEASGETSKPGAEKEGLIAIFNRSVFPFVLGYGLLVLFIYFYGVIQFFPSGLTVGDSILFLFIALGYGLLSFVFVVGGLACAGPSAVALEAARAAQSQDAAEDLDSGESTARVPSENTIDRCTRSKKASERPPLKTWMFFLSCGCAFLSVLAAWGLSFFGADTSNPAQGRFGYLSQSGYWIASLLLVLSIYAIALLPLWTNHNCRGALKRMDWSAFALAFPYLVAISGGGVAIREFGGTAASTMLVGSCAGLLILLVLSFVDSAPKVSDGGDRERLSEMRRRQRIVIFMFISAAWFAPLLWDVTAGRFFFTKRVVSGLSLRTDEATVRASGKGAAILAQAVEESGSPVHACRDKDGSVAFSPVDVLWHGVGKRSWLALPGGTTRFEVDSDDIKIVRDPVGNCHDLLAVEYFPSQKSEPVPELRAPFLRELRDLIAEPKGRWRLERLEFTGHVDPMSLPEGANDALACARASQAAAAASAINGAPSVIDVLSAGSRSPAKESCMSVTRQRDQRECQALNRRVTARAYFALTATMAASAASDASFALRPRESLRCADIHPANSRETK